MAECIINIIPNSITPDEVNQQYSDQDSALINSTVTSSLFNPNDPTNNIELSIYDQSGAFRKTLYNYSDYTVTQNTNTRGDGSINNINIDPKDALIASGFAVGTFTTVYRFLKNHMGSSAQNRIHYIKEISGDRTELRIDSNILSSDELINSVKAFSSSLSTDSDYFNDFYLNLGSNVLLIANNILLVDEDTDNPTFLVKLYDPLPIDVGVNSNLWFVTDQADPINLDVFIPLEPIEVEEETPPTLSPNFNINLIDEVNNSTEFKTLNDLVTVPLTSSYNQLQQILNQKGVKINVDYTEFDEFVQLSSAKKRLENFYYKASLIENYNNEITILNNITGDTAQTFAVSSSKAVLESKILDIIQNFDGYDYFLYYDTGSKSWPKENSLPPYTLYSTGSTEVLNWYGSDLLNSSYYGGQILSASNYDRENSNSLVKTIPEYLRDDPDNALYDVFIEMMGQHFDNLWLYTKDVTNRYDNDNRLNFGISRDLVAQAIRDFGVKIYQNNFSTDDLYSAFLGINASGSLLPPTGSEVIETYITASNQATPLDEVNKQIYKRIYHNLPYLLKKKGTIEGLRALITCYGIPDTILRISEFGGKDKDNSNDWDYFQNKANYGVFFSGSLSTRRIATDWVVNTKWDSAFNRPESMFFRFKPKNILPESEERSIVVYKTGPSPNAIDFKLTLNYSGSSYSSGSYSGSIPSSSNDYATLTLWDGTAELNKIEAPFYDGNWWSVQVGRTGETAGFADVVLRTANSIYNGNDGFKIGYYTSSVLENQTFAGWTTNLGDKILYIPYIDNTSLTLDGDPYYGLTGSYQELRFYSEVMPEGVFKDYVLNPYSIEGISPSSSADNLIFRAPLGADLNTSTGTLTSVHPKITGSSVIVTQSFNSDSDYVVGSLVKYTPQTEFIYQDQPAVGIKNRISEKIRNQDMSLPTGNTLSPYTSIQQKYPASASYTRDINYLEVAFSPQNEINDDINSSFGYFNIGEYIGDPRLVSESSVKYPALDTLRDDYFQKYYKNYDLKDYVRLIKYFDNSLFKMIKDFVPARTSVATGVVIKQHLLERNKYPLPQVSSTQPEYTASISTAFISGSTGGVLNSVNNLGNSPEGQSQGYSNPLDPYVTQSWVVTYNTPSGSVAVTQSTQDEFYNGEFSGSTTLVTDGELNSDNPYKDFPTGSLKYGIKTFAAGVGAALNYPFEIYGSSQNIPDEGQIYVYYDTGSTL